MADSSRYQNTPPDPKWVRFCRGLWQVLRFFWGTIALGLLLNIVASLLFLSRNTDPHTLYIWPLVAWTQQLLLLSGLVVLGLIAVTSFAWIGNHWDRPNTQHAVAPNQQSRKLLISTLRQEYTRRLTHSLQGKAMIVLELHERADITRSSAQLVFRHIETTEEHARPLGTSMIEMYDDAKQGLLILGEPGTGKTTLLLDLASELLMRADVDTLHPIPVILNLSSWASKKPPLASWIIDQLRLVYQVPSHFGQSWLEQDQWLLLLDGLDEVATAARSACIDAINAFREEHFVPLVVCSRSQEYLAQDRQLALPNAVIVQPLQERQVVEYLQRLGKPFAAVRTALRGNPVLRHLITTPLMLNVVILTYRDKKVKDLPQLGTAEEQQRQIFDRYVEQMLGRKLVNAYFTSQQTEYWLSWLAQQMKLRSLTEFYLERLQPDWLLTKQTRKLYTRFVGLVVGLGGGLISGLGGGLISGLVFGLISGLVVGLISGLGVGLISGLLAGLISGDTNIEPAEVLEWSWKDFWHKLPGNLLVGLLLGLLLGLTFGLIELISGPLVGLAFGLLVGLLSGLVFSLNNGLSDRQLNVVVRNKPNQGILSSGWNALRGGLLVGLLSGLLGGLSVGLLSGLLGRLSFRLVFTMGSTLGIGLNGVLVFGLIKGGGAYFGHYALRFILWRSGVMPWRYALFLEEAVERILLQRVGGGYRFIHPLFLDYFASLSIAVLPSSSLSPENE